MSSEDKTKEVLEEMLTTLYLEQSDTQPEAGDSYLMGGDGQFLGKVTSSPSDNESILNQYGPYGSPYSPTSIFNPYSPYGSAYGPWSLKNLSATAPPKLFIGGHLLGEISANPNIANRIPTEAFLYTLKKNVDSLLAGQIKGSETEARRSKSESFIAAANGTFLGRLNPNPHDLESIFNRLGPYGNKFSPTSIFNTFSQYGSKFSPLGPFNPCSATPPKVYVLGVFKGYLTANTAFQPRIDPDQILQWASKNVIH